MSQGLITLFVGVLVYLWFSRFKHAVTWWKRVPTLRDRAWDLAELDLPRGWRPGEDLNGSAGIEAVDLLHSRYVVVISESLDDYPSADLDAFAVGARDALTSDVRQLNVRGPERRTVGGFDAIQFDIEGVHDVTRVRVLVHRRAGPPSLPPDRRLVSAERI